MAKKTHPKYIFVVGGVISGVGKGVASSSIAKILEHHNYNVTAIKIDPYINVDAGTMNPTEHGEVFVLKDGDETDQDMGNYERFLDIDLTSINYMTTGRVYLSVIEKERNLEYGGKCVEVVPHIPMEVIGRIEKAQKSANADITIIEIGGTAGEYQNMIFLEAARMMKNKNPDDVIFVMVSYLPTPSKIGEMKTKPTQNAVRTLNASGVTPDILIARSDVRLDSIRKEKLAMFCNVPHDNVISAPDVDSIYDVPVNFTKENLDKIILKKLSLGTKFNKKKSEEWQKFAKKTKNGKKQINIGIVGKYFATGEFTLADSYISVIEAIKYSAYYENRKPIITWLSAEDFEKNPTKLKDLKKYDGIIIPGGFGKRGIEGKIKVIEYLRKNKIPFFGLCYGMQLAVVEYARNVLGIKDAHTVEIDPKTKNPVINIMQSQKSIIASNKYGGTMRLGEYKASLKPGTIAQKAYGGSFTLERHRHRYEVNNVYVKYLENKGLVFSGINKENHLMEIAELPKKVHPFFLATQFHPEFLARPLSPHPLFSEFIRAAIKNSKK